MTALSKDIQRLRLNADPITLGRGPAAQSITFYRGSIVMTNAGGYVTVGAAATGQFARGVCTTPCVSPGSNGAIEVGWEEGDFEFESGTSGDALTVANIGDTVYIIDDNTVGATDGSSARSAAGKMVAVSPNGKPIVRIGLGLS